MGLVTLKPKPIFSGLEELLKQIITFKASKTRGSHLSIKPRDLRLLGVESHYLETQFGIYLRSLERAGLLKLRNGPSTRPKRYIVTAKLLARLFNLDYSCLRDKLSRHLSPVELLYIIMVLTGDGGE